MEKIKLNVCSLGDPTDPKTWSGTPYNLYSELKEMDRLGVAFCSSATVNKYERRLINLLNRFHYGNSVDLGRGHVHRHLNSKVAIAKTAMSSSSLTLHTGTLDLPFVKLPSYQKHYLFCDTTWNLWASQSTNMLGYTKKLLKAAEELEKKAYHQMEHIFTISCYVKDNIVSHYKVSPCKITVVGTGLGVIKPFFGLKDYSNGKILFAAKGRFKDKGGHLVLEAFDMASKINPNLELIVVGQKEYINNIKIPNVKVYGFIDLEQLQNIFNESSLFLMPAINEPWGLVYLEALACKMPIVGLNRNSFPEISENGKYGFGLHEADPLKLSEIMLRAFSNPQHLAEMGEKGQEYCLNKFSWNKTVCKIVNTIERLENEKINCNNINI